jgi:thiamine-phosphate pyrophosphorylase
MDAKPCGLISIIPPALETEWAARLAEFVGRFKPAALILQAPPGDPARRLISKAKEFELAVLLADDVEAARAAGASGVYLKAPDASVSSARKALGGDAIIGAACGLSRHAAMESAEAGADFVAFDAASPAALEEAAGLSRWWDEITGVPAALSFAKTRPTRSAVAAARADFLILEESGQPGESLTFATEFGFQSQT